MYLSLRSVSANTRSKRSFSASSSTAETMAWYSSRLLFRFLLCWARLSFFASLLPSHARAMSTARVMFSTAFVIAVRCLGPTGMEDCSRVNASRNSSSQASAVMLGPRKNFRSVFCFLNRTNFIPNSDDRAANRPTALRRLIETARACSLSLLLVARSW